MFAKRPVAPNPPPQPTLSSIDWIEVLSNPYLGAAAAAGLILLAGLVFIGVAGNPRAGAPSVRVALSSGGADALRPNLAPGASGLVMLDNLTTGQEAALPDAPIQGDAVITLPQGGTVGAGAPGAAEAIPVPRTQASLAAAPIAGLSAPGPAGPLPVIAKDGRTSFQAYARPFHDNGKPKVALVIGGLGLNAASTQAAIDRLPPEVTLSFVPYADNLQSWIDRARAAGHEVLLEIPMEPLDYPSNDPGPYTLMANAAPGEINRRLEWLLSRASGYFGVTNYLGGRFVGSNSAMAAFAGALKGRGLAFVDDGSAARRANGPPRASADAVIDEELSANAIDKQLLALEAQAQSHGAALGSGFSYPVTLEQVGRWAAGLASRGYQLAPASAVARRS